MIPFQRLRQDPVVSVAALSGLAGFVVGCFGYGTWQVAVESAQVLAGLVEYPRDNPFYLYHTKLWTLSHQLPALLLWAGLDERVLSLLLSGALGMLSFQALALTVLALSGDKLLALGTPFFIECSRATMFWIAYPVWLLGTSHTYGVLGLSAALLAVVLFANGRHRAGAFALGLMPAVHPSIAAWLWVLASCVVAWHFGLRREALRPLVGPFLIGCALSAISLTGHMFFTYDVPTISAETASRYLVAFVRGWDGHRRPLFFTQDGVRLALGAAVLALPWIFFFRSRPESRFLLRFVVACGVLGIGLIAVSRMPPEVIPEGVLVLMPNRLLNLNVLVAVALLVGLLGLSRHPLSGLNLAALLTLGVVLPGKLGVSYWTGNSGNHPAFYSVLWPSGWPLRVLGLSALGLVLAAALPSGRGKDRRALPQRPRTPLATVLRGIALLALAGSAALSLSRTATNWGNRDAVLRDFRNDPLLAKVAQGRGLLLTAADLHLIQLRTRRPVLTDGGAIDIVAYALPGGPKLEEILRRGYGVDFFRPPAEVAASGTIPRNYTRTIWRRRTAAEWKAIGRELGVTGVLTYPDWTLDLPLVDRNDELAYYVID